MSKILITPRSFSQNNPKPLEILKEVGFEVLINPYNRIMTKSEMIDIVKDVDGVILGVDPFDKDVIESANKLKVISRYGVGLDNIDVDVAEGKDIKIYRTVGANADAVADYAFALILDVSRKVTYIDSQCRKGNWQKIKTHEVWQKKLGIIGLGAIGKGLAKRASGFDMKVMAYDLHKDEAYARDNNIEYVDFETIIKESDFISLHLPLTETTRDLISYKEFEQMKDTAIIINTSRGGVIDEKALYDALVNNQIGGAGIDVFEVEPPRDQRFFELDNIVLGSHCSASSFEAIDNMSFRALENLLVGFNL